MPTLPGHQPIEPDTPNPQDPIHHPRKPDHPVHDEREEDGIDTDDDEDTGSDPWWMQGGAGQLEFKLQPGLQSGHPTCS